MKIKKFLPENKGLAIFSLLSSITLWVIASLDTEHKATLKMDIEVKPPKGMMVLNYQPKVADVFVKTRGREFLNLFFKKKKIVIPIRAEEAGIKEIKLSSDYIKPEIKGEINIISPLRVVVTLSKKSSRRVRLYPDIRGKWKEENKTVGGIEYPDSVEIEGPEQEIKLINVVYTDPVLLDTLKDTVFRIRVIPPDSGFKIKPREVKITLHLETETEKTIKGVPVEIINGGEGVKVEPASADITVAGPVSLLKRLSIKDIKVRIDVDDKTQGKYTLPAEITLPEGVKFIKCEPSEFTVIIE